ncbi:DUF6691 family protein [Devosia sp. 63-57]|uniref:DUF6691 family protein n=1 Tax=Devosia sp. 63-57 TaxID=1895751 RepID=UPI00086BB8C5|nr:DUF6691 family protein [Devosia sp. 63-57]ODT47950.1 MAG: permease [Pelagibacterium sp. SCN 63-126]ODU87919.1 MAG: permease [Pelagibacterium sp. SCN 63-17]OJX42340.1 MAG: permease [Devosia sp. 63-57]
MQRTILAGLIGIVFGTGIAVSGMSNPAKVLNFFDVAGTWDPSLLLVMASALLVTSIGYRFVLRRPKPVLEARFHLPTNRRIDMPLIAGAAVFGIGWGISGFCPGGAIPALGLGEVTAWAFVGAMMAGIFAARTLRQSLAQRATQSA